MEICRARGEKALLNVLSNVYLSILIAENRGKNLSKKKKIKKFCLPLVVDREMLGAFVCDDGQHFRRWTISATRATVSYHSHRSKSKYSYTKFILRLRTTWSCFNEVINLRLLFAFTVRAVCWWSDYGSALDTFWLSSIHHTRNRRNQPADLTTFFRIFSFCSTANAFH